MTDVRQGEAVMVIPARPVQVEDAALTQYVLVVPDRDGDGELARYSMGHTFLREA